MWLAIHLFNSEVKVDLNDILIMEKGENIIRPFCLIFILHRLL